MTTDQDDPHFDIMKQSDTDFLISFRGNKRVDAPPCRDRFPGDSRADADGLFHPQIVAGMVPSLRWAQRIVAALELDFGADDD